jgi:signal transduction histidine kinase
VDVEFYVIDKGIGISLEDRANLFEPYYKSKDQRKKGFESHGLGLSISKRIAKGLGGNLYLSNDVIDGCVFCLAL